MLFGLVLPVLFKTTKISIIVRKHINFRHWTKRIYPENAFGNTS